ncbi:hypothetical protein NW756_013661 [Fusarium oxysporum]|uniref:Uncharacterized protein n=1 Tax=Fusarium oxysporum f. sp. melonis 26406 TaxID=1089452 RepID=W9ZAY6_FUSOX|nr:hypothetical protein FOMG_17912 [Fusarium oxysporum f. sp. melonis 26406]KAJ4028857.1 hypothetical protein NW753_014438 [Fusarium oxysporum]WKT52673.1 hypothetical protein QSH57_003235 [Fusarium oxysporum f. sp. vasinfectum]KAJ4034946.1 hypothetical protein NW763_014177 [Fusarium oxysporum]KAJ4051424.1 hypothetical protein NW758_003766 [Fusarium oxysporum]
MSRPLSSLVSIRECSDSRTSTKELRDPEYMVQSLSRGSADLADPRQQLRFSELLLKERPIAEFMFSGFRVKQLRIRSSVVQNTSDGYLEALLSRKAKQTSKLPMPPPMLAGAEF